MINTDDSDLKTLISAMFGTIIAGDVPTQVKYMTTLIGHIRVYLQRNGIRKNNTEMAYVKFLFVEIVKNLVIMDSTIPDEKYQETVVRVTNILKRMLGTIPDWESGTDLFTLETIDYLYKLDLAQVSIDNATLAYYASIARTGDTGQLATAKMNCDRSLSIVTEVLYGNDLIVFSVGDWKRACSTQPIIPAITGGEMK